MENLAIQILIGALLGVFLGNLRSRHIATDLFLLGIWVVLCIMNPSYLLGAAIGGYLLGWGWRCHRLSRADNSENTNEDNS